MAAALELYRAATAALEPAANLFLHRRLAEGKEDLRRWPERLGKTSTPRPEGSLVWLHGASVGESLSLFALIDALRARRPDLHFLLTSGTLAAAELIAKRPSPDVTHQFAPLDLPQAARRFAAYWRPDLIVFCESEIWPNLLRAAKSGGAKIALVSARMSASSLKSWSRAPRSAADVLGGYDLLLPQDDEAAARFFQLGGRPDGRLNLKWAGEPLPVASDVLRDMRTRLGDKPALLAASTHPGEDEIVLSAFAGLRDRARLILAPRHTPRGGAITELSRSLGFATAQRSAADDPAAAEIYIADSLGELGLWFRLSASSLIAGSLISGIGGHNPLEAARLNAPVISGPHVSNWSSVYAAFDQAGAVAWAPDAEALFTAWRADLDRPEAAQQRAAAAYVLAQSGGDALASAADHLIGLLS